ncbi:MAG TPA: efflux RND transporter periplasmic adaptor subunit [Rhodanobacteraceae bacterium]
MLCAAIVVAVALTGCSSGQPASQQAAASTPHDVTLTRAQRRHLKVLTVQPMGYHTTVDATGAVDFDRNRAAQVLAPFSGAVSKVLVTLGTKVHEGQPLATVDSPDFAAAAGAYRKAVLAARAADAVASNDRDLYAHKAISARENAQAQADAAGADADRAAALQALVALHMNAGAIAAIAAGKTTAHGQGVIRAPITGTVVEKSVAPGQTLAAGATPCFTIADTAKMWVMAQVFGADIGKVQAGDAVTIDTGDGAGTLTGTVTNVGAVIDPATRSVNARVSVANPQGRLKKGMYVSVRIDSHALHSGLLVPASAVLRNGQNLPFVYVVTKHGGYARRRVVLGPRVGNRFVISQGLHASDTVVVEGSIFLHFIQTQ